MKDFILLYLLVACLSGKTQTTTNDSVQVVQQIDAFFRSWNNHDFSNMKDYVAEDCDFINVAGMHWKGREDIEYAHNKVHEIMFKDKPLTKVSVGIRFITGNVSIALVMMHLEGVLVTPDGMRQDHPDALATFVLQKQGAVWLIAAVENVFIDKAAAPFNPILLRNKNPVIK